MKKSLLILVSAIGALFSCSRGGQEVFDSLDRAILLQDHYDSLYLEHLGSLRSLYLEAGNDSLRWEKAFELE